MRLSVDPKKTQTQTQIVKFKLKLHCDRVSRPVRLGVRPPSVAHEHILLLLDICGLSAVGRPPWREDGSVIYLYNSLTLSGPWPWPHDHILLSHLWLSNLEGQVPVLISPRNRVVQFYPRALGSLFVASYDSQGSGGGILTRRHMDTNCQFSGNRICRANGFHFVRYLVTTNGSTVQQQISFPSNVFSINCNRKNFFCNLILVYFE
jgi:hypothetical protein